MPELDPRLAGLFAASMDLSPAEREAYLAQHCAQAPELRAMVLALLHSHDTAGEFLATPAGLRDPLADPTPDLAGRYRILAQIGAGAMGAVYRSEQLAPVHREVALKVLAAELGGAEAHARFHAEQQAVAILDHPHIARLYDSGTTVDGRPYFAMELVHGQPIHEFCAAHLPQRRDRVALLAQVCRAVHYAHQKGLVHRDLKPSNVLVAMQDGQPTPRVIDFGVAKALAPPQETMSPTAHGELLGTLEYMSPEQAGATADIDTRADVYSLGVLLHQLLTGDLPFPSARLRGVPLAEALRIVREAEPPLPSASTGDPTLRELDWVARKAMAKERARRYGSAAEFADDLEHYLRHEPLLARPDSAGYRFTKLLRRHRVLALASLAVVLAIAAGVVATLREAAHARGQRDLAVTSGTRAAQTLRRAVDAGGAAISFLGETLANIAGATRARRQQAEITLRMLEQMAALPDTEGVADWGLSYAWQRLGEVQLAMGEPADALASFTKAHEIRARRLTGADADSFVRPLAVGHWKLSEALGLLGRFAEAEAHDRQALDLHRQSLARPGSSALEHGVYLGIALRRVADHAREHGDLEGAARDLLAAQAVLERGLAESPDNAMLLFNLAVVFERRAEVHTLHGETALAAAMLAQAETSLQAQSLRAGPANIFERRMLARCHLARAALDTGESRHAQALAAALAAGRLVQAIADADPWLHEISHLWAEALLAQARALAGLGRIEAARAAVVAAKERLTALRARSREDTSVACSLARACLLAAGLHQQPADSQDAAAAVAARAAAAAERAQARDLLQELQAGNHLPQSALPLLTAANER